VKNIDWVKGAVIYQIFPDRFARSRAFTPDGVFEQWDSPETRDGFKGGNLKGVEERLDYLAGLGATAIYDYEVGPTPGFVFESTHESFF